MEVIYIPLAPIIDYTVHLTKLLILKCEWTTKKKSIERRVYEWVDEKSLP